MPKIVDKEEKKAEILDAAIRAFARRGAAGTKIQDIADEAGVGKGTIYLYFKNKEEILENILRQKVSSGEALVKEILTGSDKGSDRLRRLISNFTTGIENHQYPPEIQLEILAATICRTREKDKLSREVVQFRNIIGHLLEDLLQGDDAPYDAKVLASGLLGLLHGLMILRIIDREEFPIKKTMNTMLAVILKALQPAS